MPETRCEVGSKKPPYICRRKATKEVTSFLGTKRACGVHARRFYDNPFAAVRDLPKEERRDV
jgi:hypothetical protein